MATGTILFPIAGADLDDDDPPELVTENSVSILLFNDTTDEIIYFALRLPTTFSSTVDAVLKVQYEMVSATSGNIQFGCAVMAIDVPGSADGDVGTESYDTANTNTSAVSSVAGGMREVSITLVNNDCMNAEYYVIFKMYRDADGAADTAAGDMGVRAITLEFTV